MVMEWILAVDGQRRFCRLGAGESQESSVWFDGSAWLSAATGPFTSCEHGSRRTAVTRTPLSNEFTHFLILEGSGLSYHLPESRKGGLAWNSDSRKAF